MHKKIITFLLFAFLFSSITLAETWSDVSALIQNNNNELKSAKNQAEAASLAYRQSYTNFFPQLSASTSYSQTTTSTSQAQSQYSYGLNATQYIFKGFSSYYAVQYAYANYEYNHALLKDTEANVNYEVLSAFNDLFVAQQEIKLQTKILSRRKENTRLISLNYSSGTEDKGNLMQTQADQVAAEYNVSFAKRNLRLAKLKFIKLLGCQIETAEMKLDINVLPSPDFDSLVETSPQYLISKHQLDMTSIAQKSTIGEFLPSVSLSANIKKIGDNWPPNVDSNSWSVNVSYPFFTGGSNVFDQVINNVKLDQAKENFEKAKKGAYYKIKEAYEKLNDALESLRVAKIYAEATTERSKISQKKYLNGLILYDEWYRTENDYISRQINYVNAQKSALAALADWYKSYGGFKQ